MTELRGRLQDFGLGPLVQFGAELGRSGCLTISQAGWVGEVHFADGRVVAAVVGEEYGQAAIELIALALADGDFIYSECTPAIDPTMGRSATELQGELEELLARPMRCGRPLLRSVPHVTVLEDATAREEIALSRAELAVLLDVASDEGEIGIWRREDDHWVDMLPWTRSGAVNKGGTSNELALRAVGQQLTFLVNGIEATTVVDAVLSSGRVGAFVGGDNNEVVLDRFGVQLPPTAVGP